MIDTFMALWNRYHRCTGVKVFCTFLFICICISLLLLTIGITARSVVPGRANGPTNQPQVVETEPTVTTQTDAASVVINSASTTMATPVSKEQPCVVIEAPAVQRTPIIAVNTGGSGVYYTPVKATATSTPVAKKTPNPVVSSTMPAMATITATPSLSTPESGDPSIPVATATSTGDSMPTAIATGTSTETTMPLPSETEISTPELTVTSTTGSAVTPVQSDLPTSSASPSSTAAMSEDATANDVRVQRSGGGNDSVTPTSVITSSASSVQQQPNESELTTPGCLSNSVGMATNVDVLALLKLNFGLILGGGLLGTMLFYVGMFLLRRTRA